MPLPGIFARPVSSLPLATAFIVVTGMLAFAADAPHPTFDDPAQVTDPDFALQGEFEGTLRTDEGSNALGIQVIALGNHEFLAVAYLGGLPGAGWYGSSRLTAKSEIKEGALVFVNERATATVKSDGIVVTDPNGKELGRLPRVARTSTTLGGKPPDGAVILFDGTSTAGWRNGRRTSDNLLMQGVTSERTFQGGTLHLEFRTPYQPTRRGQERGNSGCYLQGRYEVQILDSFGLEGKNNECGGIYGLHEPEVNMCLPPLTWQTYDIDFTPAEFEDGKKTKSARMTVRHNGVIIHDNVEVPKSTTAAPVAEGPEPGPIYLQDHGNPVRFRNVWFATSK